MRISMVVFSDAGHLNAMLALGQHLEARGHELSFFSVQLDVTEACARAGLRARCAVATREVSISRDEAQRSVKLGQQLGNARWLQRWLSMTLVDAVPAVVEALAATLRDERPDLVVTDAMAYAGAVAATRAGVPWASLATTALSLLAPDDPMSQIFQKLAPARDRMTEALGCTLGFRGSDVVSPYLNVAFVAQALFPEVTGVHLVGPVLPLQVRPSAATFPWERLPSDGRALVLVCFGSHLSPRPEIYPTICGALTADEASFVCVLKDLLGEAFVAALPPHVLPVSYAPQLQLLERTAVMVHHGGANSVMECISRGVPMMIVPLGYDQHGLGHAVERAGIGAVVDQAEATSEKVRSTLLRLLDPAGPRARAQALGAVSLDGASRTVDLLEQLAGASAAGAG